MKRVFLLIGILAFLASNMYATVLLTEDFNYTVGTAIGEADAWTTTGDITSGDGRIVNEDVLSYSNIGGGEYILSGEGKSLRHNYASNKTGSTNGTQYLSYRSFTQVTSGTVYLTYIYKPDGNQNQSNGELLGLTTGTSPSARPWAGKLSSGDTSGETYRLGLTRQSGTSSDIVWGEAVYSKDDIILIVLKYDITNGSASLFVNPALGTAEEPTANIIASTDGSVRTKIDAIMFRNTGASKSNYYVGGVRVSTTWAEAVAKKNTEPVEVETVERVNTDFSDGTWGEISGSAYTSGSYPSGTINGFELSAAGMQSGSITYSDTGERFTNRISIDQNTNSGMITLPAVASAAQIVVYASSGTEDKALKLQKYNFSTEQWSDIATYTFAANATCYRFSTTLDSSEPTRLRLANADGSTKYIWKIQTYPMPPVVGKESVNYTFADAVWSDLGDASTTATVNEVNFTNCSRQTSTYDLPTGEILKGRISLEGGSGVMELPAVASATRVDIYASAGSNNKNLQLQQYNYGSMEWENVQTLHFDVAKTYYRFSVTLNSSAATLLRLNNTESGVKYVTRIISFPAAPADLATPVALDAANINAHSFTARWNAVTNANGYRIVLYGSDGKVTKVNEADINATAYNFSGLDAETNYTYKVAAIGDNESLVDSYLSDAIAVTTAAEITDTYARTVTNGNYGTICLPKASEDLSEAGAVFYEVAGKIMEDGKLKQVVFDEVTELIAGVPYVFQATASELNIPLIGDAVAEPDNSGSNGLIGSFTVTKVSNSVYNFILSNNLLYCAKGQVYYVGENRAYFDISSMSDFSGESPAPGRRRAYMTTEENQTATGIDNTSSATKATKQMIDGKIVIILGGEKFDLTGQRL